MKSLTSTSTSHGERPNDPGFNPRRLELARRRRGLSQTGLAVKIGIDRRSIVGYEGREYQPSAEVLQVLSTVLDFPVSFFHGPDLEVPEPDAVSFRALSRMTAAQRDMAIAQGALALTLNKWIDEEFHLPNSTLPDLSNEPDPESAAMALRYAWGRGERPIKNLLHLMEANGVRVFSLSVESREVDAFSMWNSATPMVFLNTQKSAERSRFDAAHELGHLVMHRHAQPQGRQAEREADAFASAFLMPQKSIIAHAPSVPTLPALIKLKHQWNVSVAALTYRLRSLDLLTEWTYRSMFQDLSQRGYHLHEPEPGPRETSQILAKVTEALRDMEMSLDALAAQLDISRRELDQLMFGLVLTTMRGGKKDHDDSKQPKKVQDMPRPPLKMIKNNDLRYRSAVHVAPSGNHVTQDQKKSSSPFKGMIKESDKC